MNQTRLVPSAVPTRSLRALAQTGSGDELAGAWPLRSEGVASLLFPVPVGDWSNHLFSGSAVVALGVGGMLVRRERNARALAAHLAAQLERA